MVNPISFETVVRGGIGQRRARQPWRRRRLARGLTGLRALGSVGERVAHHAPCSVLIVRRPAHPIADADRE